MLVKVREYQADVRGQTEARQPTLVYVVRHREDKDNPNIVAGTFFIHTVPYFALIDIKSTHSYTSSTVSMNLGISTESNAREIFVISPLG